MVKYEGESVCEVHYQCWIEFEGMSDLSIYELDDIIWDDFERSGDHIVPEPTNDHGSEDKREGDTCKKPRHEATTVQSTEESNMMEQDSWSHIPDGVFTASGDADSAKVVPTLPSGSELCTDEGIVKDTSGAVDSNSYNDLNLFSNDGNDKESSDLLYYGWPDIGNFEDVDRMLSNCDSSFGLGVTGNDDELVWFTSQDPAGGYEEALKMDLKFPSSEPSDLTKLSQEHEPRGSDNKRSSYVYESKNEFKLQDQKEQSRRQNQTEGKSDQVFTSICNQQQYNSLDYMKSNPYLHPGPGHSHVPIQSISHPMMSGIKFENKGPTPPSRKEIINESMESYGDLLFQPSFSGNQKQTGTMLQASRSDLVSPQKQFRMDKGFEGQSDMEGVKKGVSTEGSSISSELDEISLEATSFRQLLQVMEQLDLRTKLCIRDSLYRLARSAEQRHNYAGGISDSTTNGGGTGGPLMAEGTSKYTGLMDMETDTNPIDRTIAHLLFHRPSDLSNMPTPMHLKPNVKVPQSTTGTPMEVEKLSCQQVENESDDKISSTGKN